jgi:thiosulfate/3-mercaptopyruvate sulfurtransferase
MLAPVAFLLISAAIADDSPAAAYPRPDLLVEAAGLAKPETASKFRILDARSKVKYETGHIPGAVWVDHDAWNKAMYAKQDPKEWAQRIGALGIDNQSRVAIYDDASAKDAARIWWILRYWRVQDARLLNGGFAAYKAAALPLSKETVVPAAARFAIKTPDAGRFADKSKVVEALGDKKTQIVDARSELEYCGIDKLKNKKGGAIPGALHLEWTEALDKQTQKFKSPAELARVLKNAGIDVARPAVTHCQSGGRAAVMAFTLELMGAKEVANYYRGWSEWGNADDTPIVTPKKK